MRTFNRGDSQISSTEVGSPNMPIRSGDSPIVRFQILTHPSAVLVKTIEHQSDGTLKKTVGGQIPQGSAITTHEGTLDEYVRAAFHGGIRQYVLPSNVELGNGLPIRPKFLATENAVDRTAATLKYVDGPAILTFDHDPNARSRTTLAGPEELHSILLSLFPELFRDAAYGSYASSGSNIYDASGQELVGLQGFHLIFAVDDARKIPEFGDRLFKRLWLAGHGYVAISKSGSALERTLFDKKPFEPQQPIFSGGAHCVGCEQRRAQAAYTDGGYLKLDALAVLDPGEEREYKRLVAAAKLAAKGECDQAKQKYIQRAIDSLANGGRMPKERARRIVEARLGGTLTGSDVLHFDDFGTAQVSDVLANLDKYADATLADPVDGGEVGKAILYVNEGTGKPLVFSQKHP